MKTALYTNFYINYQDAGHKAILSTSQQSDTQITVSATMHSSYKSIKTRKEPQVQKLKTILVSDP